MPHRPITAGRPKLPLALAALAAAVAAALLWAVQPARAGGSQMALQSIGSFDQPIHVAQPPGRGGILVVEQEGTIRAISDGQILSQPFLNIRSLVSCCGEQGLFSVAFPHNYPESRRFYVYFTNNNCSAGNCNLEIDEFRRAPGQTNHANVSSRRKVLEIGHHADSNHNGGPLQFGPGGLLFAGIGDGGGAGDTPNNALNKNSLLGKMLRIDPRPRVTNGRYRPYRIPADNPYVGRNGRDEVFSIGLRNPWRFSIDRPSGQAPRLAIGDVGQGSAEEVDYITIGDANGADFGWSRFEGNEMFSNRFAPPPVIAPIFTYGHSGCATIIGGHVIRGSNLPGMSGRYVYEDLCSSSASPGEIRSFVPSLSGATDDRSEGVGVSSPSSFGVDRANRYYIASLGSNQVYRLIPN